MKASEITEINKGHLGLFLNLWKRELMPLTQVIYFLYTFAVNGIAPIFRLMQVYLRKILTIFMKTKGGIFFKTGLS